MKKNSLLVLIAVMLLTGCVSASNLTEEEGDIISTYATHVVLKHDANFEDTLVDVPEDVRGNNLEQEETKGDKKRKESQEEVAPEMKLEEAVSLATAMGLFDFQIEFVDFETGKTYVEGSAMAMNALEGASLLIMHFNITNNSNQEKTCDIKSLSPQFEVTINGKKTVKAQTTILLNDLATYEAPIRAGDTVKAVLISEVEDNYLNNVETLELKGIVDGNTAEIIL